MTKKPVGYKVEDKVLEDFNKKAKENALNKSQWLENKMKEYLEKENVNGTDK